MIEATRKGDIDVLSFVAGAELTSATAMRVMSAVLKAIRPPYKIVLDCAELSALDSAGLGAIVQVYKNVRELEGELKIAAIPEGYARNIFVITRLDTIFTLYEDVEGAIAAHVADKAT